VLELAEELARRKATISEFFLAFVYSDTDDVVANLHYMDYLRRKRAVAWQAELEQGKPDPS